MSKTKAPCSSCWPGRSNERGSKYLQASHGHAGIELASLYLPDVIILDLSLPDCNGVEVVERLRGQPQTKTIPILIHTGTVLSEADRLHLAAQVQSITSKSDPASLMESLARFERTPAQNPSFAITA